MSGQIQHKATAIDIVSGLMLTSAWLCEISVHHMSTSNCMLCRSINVCNYVLWQLWQICDSARYKHITTLLTWPTGERQTGGKTTEGRWEQEWRRSIAVTTAASKLFNMCVWHLHALRFSAFGGFEFIGILVVQCWVTSVNGLTQHILRLTAIGPRLTHLSERQLKDSYWNAITW